MAEFTGERVVPGAVEEDLWTEHLSRYRFACRFVEGKQVADLGCGTGYGANLLSRYAARVVGVDISEEAIAYARERYTAPNLELLQTSCIGTPLESSSFDVVVAFEVIEHLEDWRDLLAEAERILKPDGVLLVSTPNRDYYAEARRESGHNPYHVHEFDLPGFRIALQSYFPSVRMLTQNHAPAVVFGPAGAGAEVVGEGVLEAAGPQDEAHFFLAIAGARTIPEPQPFFYVPRAANLLWERERHLRQLEEQIEEARQDHRRMLDLFAEQTAALEKSNVWAESLDRELATARSQVRGLQAELEQANQWARDLDAELATVREEHSRTVVLLNQAEATVIERSEWAMALDREVQDLRNRVEQFETSRWVRAGRTVGLGPKRDRE